MSSTLSGRFDASNIYNADLKTDILKIVPTAALVYFSVSCASLAYDLACCLLLHMMCVTFVTMPQPSRQIIVSKHAHSKLSRFSMAQHAVSGKRAEETVGKIYL